jgi:hypothetical protein
VGWVRISPREVEFPLGAVRVSCDFRTRHSRTGRGNPQRKQVRHLIYQLDPISDPRWEEFLQRDPRASVFHSTGWLDAILRTYGYTPVVFTTTAPERPLENGAVFSIVKSWLVSPRLVSLPFSDHVDPLMENQGALEELLKELRNGQQYRRWKKVEFRPPATGRQHPGWTTFYDGQSFVLHHVDLRPGLDRIYSRFHHDSIQRKIHKAERSGVQEDVGRSEHHLRQFFTLHAMTRRRKGLPPPPFSWFRNIVDCLGEQAKIRVASMDGCPIAAILTLRFKETAVYKYGCTDNRYHNLGAMPFLLWAAMQEEFHSGALDFDLGRSELDNPGLIRFKEKFGAGRREFCYKIFPAEPSPTMDKNWRLIWARKLFGLLPEKALIYAGSLIYPHIG